MSTLETVSVPRTRLASFILTTVAIYAVVLVAVHFLRSDVDVIAQMTDAYQQGAHGSIYKGAMIVFGAGQLALALGLYRALPGSIGTTIGVILYSYWAAGTLLVSVLQVPQPGTTPTVAGMIAQINWPLHVLSLTIGAFLFSWRFKDDERWRPARRAALILSGGMVLLFLSVFANMALAPNAGFAGLTQRLFIILTLAWSTLVGFNLRELSTGPTGNTPK